MKVRHKPHSTWKGFASRPALASSFLLSLLSLSSNLQSLFARNFEKWPVMFKKQEKIVARKTNSQSKEPSHNSRRTHTSNIRT